MKKLYISILVLILTAGLSFAQNNTGTVDQYGTNYAEIDQTGADNNADIDMGSPGNPVTNYHLPAYPSDWKRGAWIEQVGQNNTAATVISNNNNGTGIFQYGNYNEGYQDIGGYSSYTNGNSPVMGVDINQMGDNNYAAQWTRPSFGSYSVQRMFIDQDGNYNVASQYSIGGMANVTNITQTGNNNNNPAESGNSFDVSGTGLTDPLSLPWAHKPAGDFAQYSNQRLGTTQIYVIGNGNNTAQYQEYTAWAPSGDNDATIDIYGNGNDAVQGQLGEYNNSDIDISGDDNIAAGSQFGDSNTATMNILGNGNLAGIEQTGNSNTGDISQTGNNNNATISQSDL